MKGTWPTASVPTEARGRVLAEKPLKILSGERKRPDSPSGSSPTDVNKQQSETQLVNSDSQMQDKQTLMLIHLSRSVQV